MSRFTKRRKIARQEREAKYGRLMEGFNSSIKAMERMMEYYDEDETTQFTCSYCTKWTPGDFWQSSDHRILCDGRCKEGLIPCRNDRRACKLHFEKAPTTSFIYQGGGGTPVEEDIANVMDLTEKLINGEL